ncbi:MULTISPECIES: ABC transporter permease [unclassified Chelatococcus]|jgi:ribose transport system permease protein|uniref:ABC transporter permease n=1 Tax=unclassified Chelatococcus TaxID=2638111 RepID=UPI001BCBFF94|nr:MULTISPECIES: ABC transporter permease [unclassified Chelatococcus]CAH1652701.1 Monosaccharide ABC transporter membrane protein (CUT2 family) [Hyphomicrobiales bacterium]MBS7740021.1 ABC transporter permease [Chelatococcus sp. HY11]MBX3545150.1 ABC transporter permease [Chelatococcus sp.]MCO5078679.1 ABC transporter permease [Chelatococcus sp.]CAH1685912.1 Monosaccharide ABC transporter membrane protein (CUT2 family) [Hyphomicrobiales bacterium]
MRLKTLLTNPLTLAAIAILALLAIGETLSPGFARGDQIVRLLTVAAILGIVAAGQNLVILGGREGIDLSVGPMISLGAVIAGNIMAGANAAILPAVLAATAVTFLIGIVNGLGVTLVRIPPLVMTLGMTAIVQGGLVVYSQGIPSGNAAPALMAFINRPLFLGLPGILFVWAIIAISLTFLLRRTAFGFAVYAIGANERAAMLVGLPVNRIRCLLYGLSGFFAGLTGVCVIGYTGNSFISVGDQYVLSSIIAVVIGGTSLAGGAGGYIGTVLGAVALVLLQSVLTTLQLENYGRQIIFGMTLLVLMLLYGRQGRLRV